jgi:hypothetical protein
MVEVVHAPEDPPLDAGALTSIDPSRWIDARFTPSRTLRVLRFAHPTNAYLQAHKDERAPEIPAPSPTTTAVYRKGFVIWRMDLTPAMAGLLDALREGAPLGRALEGIAAHAESADAIAEAERSVMAWFQAWVSEGFFAEVHFERSDQADSA